MEPVVFKIWGKTSNESKKMEILVLETQRTEFFNNLKEKRQVIPQSSKRECSPATVILVQ